MADYLFLDDIKSGFPRFCKELLEGAQDRLFDLMEAVGIGSEEEFEKSCDELYKELEIEAEECVGKPKEPTTQEALEVAKGVVISACENFEWLCFSIDITQNDRARFADDDFYEWFICAIFQMQEDLLWADEIISHVRRHNEQSNPVAHFARKAAYAKNQPYRNVKVWLSQALERPEYKKLGNSEVARQLTPKIQNFLRRHGRPLTPTNAQRKVTEWVSEIRKKGTP